MNGVIIICSASICINSQVQCVYEFNIICSCLGVTYFCWIGNPFILSDLGSVLNNFSITSSSVLFLSFDSHEVVIPIIGIVSVMLKASSGPRYVVG